MIATDLASLAARFECFLVDQFGVLVSGDGAYPGAPDALARLAAAGTRTVLVSNSGKRSWPNEARLALHGFDRASYLAFLSSGEVAHALLRRRIGRRYRPGARVLVLSRNGDVSCIEDLDLTPTLEGSAADLVLVAGSQGDRMSLDDYSDLLRPAAARNVPCLCTNPDETMLTRLGPRIGAGRIAALYEKLGGTVEWIGKPHRAIYDAALDLLDRPDPAHIVCIGDSPAHDVAGGQRAGLATALVRTGIHGSLSDADRTALCEREGAVPDFVIPGFSL